MFGLLRGDNRTRTRTQSASQRLAWPLSCCGYSNYVCLLLTRSLIGKRKKRGRRKASDILCDRSRTELQSVNGYRSNQRDCMLFTLCHLSVQVWLIAYDDIYRSINLTTFRLDCDSRYILFQFCLSASLSRLQLGRARCIEALYQMNYKSRALRSATGSLSWTELLPGH